MTGWKVKRSGPNDGHGQREVVDRKTGEGLGYVYWNTNTALWEAYVHHSGGLMRVAMDETMNEAAENLWEAP